MRKTRKITSFLNQKPAVEIAASIVSAVVLTLSALIKAPLLALLGIFMVGATVIYLWLPWIASQDR